MLVQVSPKSSCIASQLTSYGSFFHFELSDSLSLTKYRHQSLLKLISISYLLIAANTLKCVDSYASMTGPLEADCNSLVASPVHPHPNQVLMCCEIPEWATKQLLGNLVEFHMFILNGKYARFRVFRVLKNYPISTFCLPLRLVLNALFEDTSAGFVLTDKKWGLNPHSLVR